MEAIYVGSCQNPRRGTHGEAWEASGFHDHESCEQGAYLFQADGDPDGAFYCAEEDLQFVTYYLAYPPQGTFKILGYPPSRVIGTERYSRKEADILLSDRKANGLAFPDEYVTSDVVDV